MSSPTASATSPQAVLDFWFGPLDGGGQPNGAHVRRWFEKNVDFDREITERFGKLHEEIVGRKHEDWLDDPRSRLAYVIVLDQFSRNMFRDNPRAFATDAQAVAAAADGVARGHDKPLTPDERSFLYMPFMHSEDLAMQARSVDLFRKLAAEAPPEQAQRRASSVDYAQKHRDLIAKFGRFPQRNSALGRTSTGDEWEYLKESGGGF